MGLIGRCVEALVVDGILDAIHEAGGMDDDERRIDADAEHIVKVILEAANHEGAVEALRELADAVDTYQQHAKPVNVGLAAAVKRARALTGGQ